jgi:hypothetical protein
MANNAMVCVQSGEEYGLYHRNCHGGPVQFGTELIEALRNSETQQALESVQAAALGQWVRYPDEAFLTVRQDIEWIYVVRDQGGEQSKQLEIHKTSYDGTTRRFAWMVWSGRVEHLDKVTATRQMELAEMTGVAVLQALRAYERAR